MDDISVKIVIAVCVLLILVIAKIVYDEKKYIEKLTNRLKKTWGMPTRQEYTENIWKNIKYYHDNQASENDIDDITWNDLEMDRVYEKLNHTRTSVGEEYLTHLRVIQNIGMARIDEIDYNGVKIVPLQFLKAVLPNPQDLGENYEGETSIGCRIRGVKDGKERTYYVYNNCSHQEAYKETGMQGVSYTTGVPAMIGAMMFLKGLWKRPGVWNVEEFDPDPFMEQLNKQGLPWHEVLDGDLEL